MPSTKPSAKNFLGQVASAAVRFARSPFGRRPGAAPLGPAFAPTVPGGRSVPVPLAALTDLLDRYPAGRSRLKHLALIETSCQLAPEDPLSKVPPRTLEIAIRQLEPVLDHHHGLLVLRLQLERRLQTHRARVGATLALETRRWLPDPGASTFGPIELDAAGTAAFAETLPLETAAR